MLTSSKTYDIIRESGFISLPSKRTLRDYTHWTRLKPGFSAELFNHLRKEAKVDNLAEWQRLLQNNIASYIAAHFVDLMCYDMIISLDTSCLLLMR